MRAIITRRTLLALLSAIALIAVVAVTAFSLSQRQPQARAAAARPTPSMSYQVSVTTSATPGASSASPSGANRHGASTGAGAGQATPTRSPANHPGGAIAWPVPGDYASVMGAYAVATSYTRVFTAQIEMRNTGTTPWLADATYYLWCIANCLGGEPATSGAVAPGQSKTFDIQFFPPTPHTTVTYYSEWSMFHSGAPFGEIATVKIVVTVAVQLGVDPAPGCDTSSMTWTVIGGACANGGLALTANATQEPTATLQNAPAGFDDTNFAITIQANFSGATGGWVRLVSYDTGSQCVGQGMDVKPDGNWRDIQIWNCTEQDGPWSTTGSASPPIAVTFQYQQASGYSLWIDYAEVEDGGTRFTGGYPVVSVGGTDGSVVTVTDAELDTPVGYTAQWSVLQNGHQRM